MPVGVVEGHIGAHASAGIPERASGAGDHPARPNLGVLVHSKPRVIHWVGTVAARALR